MRDKLAEFTLFVSDPQDVDELQKEMESAGFEAHVVVCAKEEDTPYLRSTFTKIAGRGNIRRFLATETSNEDARLGPGKLEASVLAYLNPDA